MWRRSLYASENWRGEDEIGEEARMQDWLCVKCAGAAKLRVLEDGRLRPLCEKHGARLLVVATRSGIDGRPTKVSVDGPLRDEQINQWAKMRGIHPSSIDRAVDGKPIFDAPNGSAAPPKDGWAPTPEDTVRGYQVFGASATSTCPSCGEAWSVNAIHACKGAFRQARESYFGPPVKGENAVVARVDGFKVGQWVRWTHDGSGLAGCAKGQLAQIDELHPLIPNPRVLFVAVCELGEKERKTLGGDQISPALPRCGEWWVGRHGSFQTGHDWTSEEFAAERDVRPENFGRGHA